MTRILLTLALFVCWSDAAAATIACRSSPGTDDYYQYRLIDGRKCWFRGHTKLEKSALAWKSIGSRPVERFVGVHGSSDRVMPSEMIAGLERAGTGRTGAEGSNPSRSTNPDFDAVFAHFRVYDVARPAVHLLYPARVAQAYGAKRVAVVVYRREP